MTKPISTSKQVSDKTDPDGALCPAFGGLDEMEYVLELIREHAVPPDGMTVEKWHNFGEVFDILRKRLLKQRGAHAALIDPTLKVPFNCTKIGETYTQADSILLSTKVSPFGLDRETLHRLEILLHRIFIYVVAENVILAERARKEMLSDAGKNKKRSEGIVLVVKNMVKKEPKKSVEQRWASLLLNHSGISNAIKIENYLVFINNEDSNAPKLCSQNTNKTSDGRAVTRSSFAGVVRDVKKYLQ